MSDSNNNNKDYKLSQFQRNRYFYGKLMTVKDFDTEQNYMNEKRHLLNRLVNGAGIICGLGLDDVEVSAPEESGGNVKIQFKTGGAAIDCWGREIVIPVQEKPREIFVKEGSTKSNLTTSLVDADPYYLYLEYDPREGEMVSSALENSSCEETCCPNRVIEDFEVIASTQAPSLPDIQFPDFNDQTSEAAAKQDVKDWLQDWTSDLCTAPAEGKVFFLALKKGSYPVSIDVDETNKCLSFVTNNSAFSELLASHLSDFGNPHKTLVGLDVEGEKVDHDHGYITIEKSDETGISNAITLDAEPNNHKILIGETHSRLKDSNPHETKHSQILNVLKVFDDDEDDVGNKHISNNDGENWNSAYDHSNVKDSNPHETKHSQILNVLKVFDDEDADAGNKHISNNDGENWNSAYDHSNVKDSNPHQAKHSDIIDVLPVFGDEDNEKRNKHVSNNDAVKWNKFVEESGVRSIAGVVHHDGDVALEAENSIVIKPDDENNKITFGETHSGDTGNPHYTKHKEIDEVFSIFENISEEDVENWEGFVDQPPDVDSIISAVTTPGDTETPGEGPIPLDNSERDKHVSNSDASLWYKAVAHSVKSGNIHETKHEEINEVQGIRANGDSGIITEEEKGKQNKHISINDAEKWDSAIFKINNIEPDEEGIFTIAEGSNVTIEESENKISLSITDDTWIKHKNIDLGDDPNPHLVGMSHLVDLKVADNGGNIDANNHRIVNLSDPEEAQDAANKKYVDTKTTAVQEGALSTSGGFVTGPIHIKTEEWSALSGNATETYGVMGRLTKDLETGSNYRTAGVVGVSEIEGKHGVYAKAPEGTHALYVQGSALFTGPKTGYVVDVFKNAGGKTLKTGDVVKLKGTPVNRFFGDNDKIPVAEVTMADKENDNCTIGIVDRKAIPEEIKTGKKSKAGDPSIVKDGEELYVVTLGTYFRCKVDASDAPIKVGDLLTSSKNPGHARKAADPKIGSIIGKALEPLEKGTGHIAVFVNIQ